MPRPRSALIVRPEPSRGWGNRAAVGFLDQIIAADDKRTIVARLAAPIPKRAPSHG